MKDVEVLNIMMNNKVIPSIGTFQVTASMIDEFYDTYGSLYKRTKNKDSASNIAYSKKLAGLSLMKLNISRSQSVSDADTLVRQFRVSKPCCGIVYLVTNPAWPDLAKIGITQDLEKRLMHYQTCDPYRKFKVEHYIFVENMRQTEKTFLKNSKTDLIKGEWVDRVAGKKLLMGYTA